jgi:hypothetical protein
MIAAAFLILLGLYLACGFIFALPFVLLGARKIDPHAGPGSWGFRLLIIPGAMALWPVLLHRWYLGIHEPPEECNSHRQAARNASNPTASAPPEAK